MDYMRGTRSVANCMLEGREPTAAQSRNTGVQSSREITAFKSTLLEMLEFSVSARRNGYNNRHTLEGAETARHMQCFSP